MTDRDDAGAATGALLRPATPFGGRAGEADWDQGFLVEAGEEWSRRRILTLAGTIRRLLPTDTGASEVVGVCSPSPSFVVASALALWGIGRCPLFLDPNLRQELLGGLAEFPGMPTLVTAPNEKIANTVVVEEDPDGAPIEPQWPDEGDGAALFLTSGSTGEPKIISKQLRQLSRQYEGQLPWLGVPADPRVFSLVPPFHILGFVYGLFLPLFTSGRTSFARGSSARSWSDQIRTIDPDVVVAVPSHYRLIAHQGPVELPECIYISSGAPLGRDVDQLFRQNTGHDIMQIFGSTETGGIGMRRGFGSWQPLPGLSWKIDGKDGRLMVSSPWQDDPGQWRTTDDVVLSAGDGFHLVGRFDSIVKVGGKRFSTNEIITATETLPAVHDAAAVVYERFGENAVALFVTATPGETLTVDDLKAALDERLAPFKVPRTITILDDMPNLSTGKVDREQLRKLASR